MAVEVEEGEGEEETTAQVVTESTAVPSILHQLGARQQNVANLLVGDDNLGKLTHFFNKQEPKTYAKMRYMRRAVEALDAMSTNGGDYKFPDFNELIEEDLRFREAYQKGRANDLVKITKVLERSAEPESRGGFLGMFHRKR